MLLIDIFTNILPLDVSIFSISVYPSHSQAPGVYHLSFTGLFSAENGHGIHADIVRITLTGETEYLGRSSADSNEVSTFFSTDPDDDVVSTSTVIAMSRLEVQDVIYVTTSMEKNHGESKIISIVYKNIHFIGQKISD